MAIENRSSSISNLLSLRLTDTSPIFRYGFAIFISIAALVTHRFFWPFNGDIPFFIFYPLTFAVIAIAGFGPACLTILVLGIGASLEMAQPEHPIVWITQLRLTTFVGSSLILSILMERNHRIEKKMAGELAANLQRQELLAREEQARQAAEMERARLRSLVMEAPVGINILRGPQHIIEMTNRRAHELVGGRDFTGLTLREAGTEFKPPEHLKIFDRVYETGTPWVESEFPMPVMQENGQNQERFFNIICQPWRNLEGHIVGIFDFALDVTSQVLDRKKTEVAEECLRLALKASNHGTWEWDLDTKEISLSNEAWALFGFHRKPEACKIRDDLIEYIHPEDRHTFTAMMRQAFEERHDYYNEFRTVWPDQSVHWVASHGRISKGLRGNQHMVGVAYDITERRDFEQELKNAKEEAEKASRLKSAFLANMSHEIRTPLGALIGFTDVMREPDLTPQERNQYIEIMARNGQQLSRLIDDILDLSKVEAGQIKMEYSQTDPRRLVEEVFDLLSVRAKEKNIRLNLAMDSKVGNSIVTDPNRLKQILLNMIGNSIKFTSAGYVLVVIHHFKTETDREYVEFEIEDSGIGIPEDQKNNIFKVFVQADDSMTRKFGGTGLGLPLSKSLANLLGGDLSLKKTEVGKGSTFVVRIESKPPSWLLSNEARAQAAEQMVL